MLNKEERLVVELCKREVKLALVRDLLQNGRLDASRLIKIAKDRNLAAYVLARLLQIPVHFAGREQLLLTAKREILQVTCTNLAFRRELRCIHDALAMVGLDCILLKGLSLDFDRLRTIGDLDILVEQSRIVQAIDAILAIPGYCFRLKRDAHDRGGRIISTRLSAGQARRVIEQASWNSEFHLYHQELGILAELHTRLVQAPPDGYFSAFKELASFQRNVRYFWDRRVYNPALGLFTLSPAHSLILMCLQSAFKRYPAVNAFRLSNLLDIDRLAEKGVDWGEVCEVASRFEVPHLILFSLRLARQLLDTLVPQEVLSELEARSSWSRRLAGNLHLKTMRSLDHPSLVSSKMFILLTKFSESDDLWDKIRWAFLLPILLPARWRMAELFRISQYSPILPFAYLANPIRWLWNFLFRMLKKGPLRFEL